MYYLCSKWDSNPHDRYWSGDFKSPASTYSAIRAFGGLFGKMSAVIATYPCSHIH